MTAYYVTVVDGKEVRTVKGRGRPRNNFIETSPGIWRLDPNLPAPTPKAPKVKKAPKVVVKKNFVYVRFDDDGSEIDRRKVKQGRPPNGYTKCELKDGSVYPIDGQPETSTGTDVVAEVEGTLDELGDDDGSSDDEDEEDKEDEEPVMFAGYTTKNSQSRCTAYELIKCMKFLRSSVKDKNGVISFVGCNIIANPNIEYLKFNMALSRIDIHTKTGDVMIWKLDYRDKEHHPDVIIPRGVEIEND